MNVEALLLAIGVAPEVAARVAPAMARAMTAYRMTDRRVMSQTAHESGMFAVLRESMNYAEERLVAVFGKHRIDPETAKRLGRNADHPADQPAIANLVYGGEWGVKNLGNTMPGDGWKFRGAGPIQTTGRGNFRSLTLRLRARLGPDVPNFEEHPELVAEIEWGAMAAADYWDMRAISAHAMRSDVEAVTRAINGGLNGIEARRALLMKLNALPDELFNASAATVAPGPFLRRTEEPESPSLAEAPSPPPSTPKEAPVVAPIALSLIGGLAQTLFNIFSPLAKEKLEREMRNHTDSPEVADKIATAAVEAVKAVTGKADPIEAVMAVREDPAALAAVEASVMDELERLAPLLERMSSLAREELAAADASMDAAARRHAGVPNDMDPFLTRAVIYLAAGLLFTTLVLTGFLAWAKVSETILMAVFGVFSSGAVLLFSKLGTRYDHRYGSSAGSSSKDAVRDAALTQLTKRK